MRLVKLGAAALNQTPLDWGGNKANIINAIDKAISEGVDILCLPELCITGYGCEDSFFMPSVLRKAFEVMEEVHDYVANVENAICITVGLPVLFSGAIYNCTAIISSEGCGYDNFEINIIPKQNLCSDGVHYETRWFKSWPSGKSSSHNNYSFGDLTPTFKGIKIGVEICEDAWSMDRPGSSLCARGIDVILNPSASHFSFGKYKTRESFIKEGSRAFKCAYVYSNLLGNESGRVIFDGDTYIANAGEIVSKGNRFSFSKNLLTTAVVDLDKNLVSKIQIGSFVPDYNSFFIGSEEFNHEHESGNINPVFDFKYGPSYDLTCKYDNFTLAVSLGLWNYMIKSRSRGFVLSLSGGADSGAVACLVRSMIVCAYNQLGASGVHDNLTKLGFQNLPETTEPTDTFIKKILNKVLLCVYQKTDNSSQETEDAARYLAEEIGASFSSINVQDSVNEYINLVSQVMGRTPNWDDDDIAMQNIQARVRAPSVWMMTNIRGSLLLSTSNRSEAAVGYATMDGDTCGGLAPIAGVSKQFVNEWIRDYAASHRCEEFHGLDHIVKLKPSAELRPEEQSDEDDLMPYDVLTKIEIMVVKHKMSPRSIVHQLRCDGVEKALDYVDKFFRLFTRNQWKRERYAPSFHLDDESLDPKTFFRFPILNSGFQEEIEEMKKEAMENALT